MFQNLSSFFNIFVCISITIVLRISNIAAFKNESLVNCTEYKELFANSVASFTNCAIDKSRPITLCESCVDQYLDVMNSYSNFSNFEDSDGKCILSYINLDRLQIVDTLYSNSYNLWNRAKCYECFEIVNGSLTHNRSEHTIKFNELLNNTMNCINQTTGVEFQYCSNCLRSYLDLNNYYNIVDLMNSTRVFWSKNCCKYREHSETIFFVSASVMCFLTLAFYLLIKICTDIKAPTIFQQSRFAESFNHLSSNST